VECRAWGEETEAEEEGVKTCTQKCKHGWEYSEEHVDSVPSHWVNCTHKNGSYCEYSFSYELETWDRNGPDKVILHLDEEGNKAVCPIYVKPDYFGMIIGIAGGIVGVGIITILLWKAFTTVTDRREFARFEAERQKMKWNSNANPIFKQATTTIQNPMYCKEDF
jgi:protocadherin alpha